MKQNSTAKPKTKKTPPMPDRKDFLPRNRLSELGNKLEFCLPHNSIADYIARTFDIVWLHTADGTHPGIWHPGLKYPGARPATPEEITTYRNLHQNTPNP